MSEIQERVARAIHRAERAWWNAEGEERRYSQERFQALASLAEVGEWLRKYAKELDTQARALHSGGRHGPDAGQYEHAMAREFKKLADELDPPKEAGK